MLLSDVKDDRVDSSAGDNPARLLSRDVVVSPLVLVR